MEGWYIRNNYIFDRGNLNLIKRWWLDIDKTNYLLIISIMIFGFFMTATSSTYVANRIDVDGLFFVKKQLFFTIMSIIIFTIFSFFEKDYIKLLAIFGIIISILCLIIVLINGFEIKGAKRWISIAGFTLQPSEFAKVFFLIFNAFILNKFQNKGLLTKYGLSCGLYFIVACLFILQPDFGMTFVLTLTWLTQLFVFGLSLIFIFVAVFISILAVIYAYNALPHVASRIDKFINIDIKNYQVERSIDAYINGGFFGTGLGNGFVKKYIPDAHTDFIFAVISEELGLIFAVILILVFLLIIHRIIKRILLEDNLFMRLSLIGLTSLFALQVLVNIGVSIAMLPTKGMTLPFISYGGSSMIAMAICFGVILSFTKRKYDNNIDQNNITANLG